MMLLKWLLLWVWLWLLWLLWLLLQVGGWTMMHIDDLRLLAPKWLHYTKHVRNHPSKSQLWNLTADKWMSSENPRYASTTMLMLYVCV